MPDKHQQMNSQLSASDGLTRKRQRSAERARREHDRAELDERRARAVAMTRQAESRRAWVNPVLQRDINSIDKRFDGDSRAPKRPRTDAQLATAQRESQHTQQAQEAWKSPGGTLQVQSPDDEPRGGLPILPNDAAFTPGARLDRASHRSKRGFRDRFRQKEAGSRQGSFRSRFNQMSAPYRDATDRGQAATERPAVPSVAKRTQQAVVDSMAQHGIAAPLPKAGASCQTGDAQSAATRRAARRAEVLRQLKRAGVSGTGWTAGASARGGTIGGVTVQQPAPAPAPAPAGPAPATAPAPAVRTETPSNRPPTPPSPPAIHRASLSGGQGVAEMRAIASSHQPEGSNRAEARAQQGSNRAGAASLRAMLGRKKRSKPLPPAPASVPEPGLAPSNLRSKTLASSTKTDQPASLPLVDEHGRLVDGALLRRGGPAQAPLESGDLRARAGKRRAGVAGHARDDGMLQRRFATDGEAVAGAAARDGLDWRAEAARELRAERAAGRAVAAGGAAGGAASLAAAGVGGAALGAAQDLDATMARNLLRKGRAAAEGARFLSGAGGSRAGRGEDDEEGDEAAAVALASGASDRLTGRGQEEQARRRAAQAWRREEERRSKDPYLVGGPAFEGPRVVHMGKHWIVAVPREQQPPHGALTSGSAAHDGPRLGPWHVLLVARGEGPGVASVRGAEEEAYRESNLLRARFDRMVAARGTRWTAVDDAERPAASGVGAAPLARSAGWERTGHWADSAASGGAHQTHDEDLLAVPEGALGRVRGMQVDGSKPGYNRGQTSPSDGAGIARPPLQAVFVEHAHRVDKAGVRAVVHCLAVPIQDGPSRVASRMRQALGEWVAVERRTSSASAEPRLIDAAGRGLRGCVPEGFPYLHVGWRGGGVVCPLDDAARGLPPSFALDVLCGAAGWAPARMVAAERVAAEESVDASGSASHQDRAQRLFERLQSRVTAVAMAWEAAT